MNNYETLFILSPLLKPEQLESLVKEIRGAIESEKAHNLTEEPIEKKPLAYPIKKSTEGFFLLYRFQAAPGALERVKLTLKHKDAILRSMFTVRTQLHNTAPVHPPASAPTPVQADGPPPAPLPVATDAPSPDAPTTPAEPSGQNPES